MRTIIVGGGYGHVGRALCRQLVDRRLCRVVVAGRDVAAAERLAGDLGTDASAAFVDARSGEGLTALLSGDPALVVNCSVRRSYSENGIAATVRRAP